MTLTLFQKELCTSSEWDFSDLRALYINCSLKPSPEQSHTQGLIALSAAIMEANSVHVDQIRAVDENIAPGVWPDMTDHGFDGDGWPLVYEKVAAADILVLGSPIWLGEKSSVCARVIERLYGHSSELNSNGQYAYYGKAGGCLITGNEDGIKHCSMNILYSLQHIGYSIPPQADAGWIGEAGPGPSYLDPNSGGPDNEFTNRNTTFMTWNLLHTARALKDAGGIPAHGNQRSAWDAGCRFDFPTRSTASRVPFTPLAWLGLFFGRLEIGCYFGRASSPAFGDLSSVGEKSHLVVEDLEKPSVDADGGCLIPVLDDYRARGQGTHDWLVVGKDPNFTLGRPSHEELRLA